MLRIIKDCKNPTILVMTPLLTGHKISTETKINIKRNKVDFIWASYESDNKHAMNCQLGIDEFHKKHRYLPEYIFILDRDIIPERGILDKLHFILSATNDKIAFAYCPFEYKGHINLKIPPIEYDLNRLKISNYISSNSLYKTNSLLKISGFVVDTDTHRLSDWATWLKFAINDYKGILCKSTYFIAVSTEKDISAGNKEEYNSAKELIQQRFISKL